jgi:ATP-dependent RNA helicase MSS116
VHRTGRSARAGSSGSGLLLLCDYEKSFLRELTELPIKPLADTDPYFTKPTDRSPPELQRALQQIVAPDDMAAPAGAEGSGRQPGVDTYQSWLGYYRGMSKRCGWRSNEELVAAANRFAQTIG